VNNASKKAIRDFWHERARIALVVLAIALGISGFAALLSSYAILVRELNLGYLATNPASATLQTDVIDEELLAAVVANREVSDAEPRRVVSGRIKAGPAEWRNLSLFVIKDFASIRISTLKPQQGAWPPRAGEILIERDAFQVARARIGDAVAVKTSNGKEQTLRVAGSVHDVGQAQARMENIVYGYILPETLIRLGEEPHLDQLKILVAENRFDERHIRNVVEDIRKLFESRGHPVHRVDVPRPGKHPHADLTGLLLLAIASFGLFVLILSGILVVNLLTALMASQVRQIGIMKVVGGRRWQIARIYLAQALLLGMAAMVVALPAGLLGSRLLCRYMAVFLNFDISSFAVPVWVYLLVAAVGLVVPLLAAAYPVWKGSGISVYEALASFGVSQSNFGTSSFERLVAGIGGRARPVLLAVRNSFRRRARAVLTVLTLSVGGLFFMTALNVRASMIETLDHMFAARKFDLSVGLGAMYPFERIERAICNVSGVIQAEGWITTEGTLPVDEVPPPQAAGGGAHAMRLTGGHGAAASGGVRFSIIGLPPETNLLNLDIISGRGLQSGDVDALVVNATLAAKSAQMKVGNLVSIRIGHVDTSLRLVGIAREAFSPPVAYVPKNYIEQRGDHPRMANNLRLVLSKTNAASIESIKTTLDRNLEAEGIRALSTMSKADGRFGFDQHMVMIYAALIIMSCVIGAVGGLGLSTTISLNVLERRREMGVLRAIGASPSMVWLIVVAEAGAIAVLSWGLAAIAAWPISKALGNLLVNLAFKSGLDFSFEPRGLVIWLAVSLGLAVVSSFLPAWRASRFTIREALAYE